MASSASRPERPDESAPASWADLAGLPMWLLVWIPVLAIGALHYSTGPESHWVHDILRRMYYLPILFGAFYLGLRGGVVAAAVVALTYAPHAFMHQAMVHADPARGLEKALEIVLYFVVATVAGYLADQERRRRRELRGALAELRGALEEQKQLQRQLVRAGRLGALGEVVAGIAHEVKNPLHALAGTAEIVDAVVPKDVEEHRMWELHKSEIVRLRSVAERFLSFARPAPINEEQIDLRDVARRLHDLVSAQARQVDVQVELELSDEEIAIIGDRDQLAQVGLNIALNGLKAIGDGAGKMRITAQRSERDGRAHALLTIENSGPQIEDEMMEHIFDPFRSGDDEGSGLGLAISSRIVDQHSGFIDVANEGLGVMFSVWLPRVKPPGA